MKARQRTIGVVMVVALGLVDRAVAQTPMAGACDGHPGCTQQRGSTPAPTQPRGSTSPTTGISAQPRGSTSVPPGVSGYSSADWQKTLQDVHEKCAADPNWVNDTNWQYPELLKACRDGAGLSGAGLRGASPEAAGRPSSGVLGPGGRPLTPQQAAMQARQQAIGQLGSVAGSAMQSAAQGALANQAARLQAGLDAALGSWQPPPGFDAPNPLPALADDSGGFEDPFGPVPAPAPAPTPAVEPVSDAYLSQGAPGIPAPGGLAAKRRPDGSPHSLDEYTEAEKGLEQDMPNALKNLNKTLDPGKWESGEAGFRSGMATKDFLERYGDANGPAAKPLPSPTAPPTSAPDSPNTSRSSAECESQLRTNLASCKPPSNECTARIYGIYNACLGGVSIERRLP